MSGELGGAHDTEVMGERCAAMLAELPDELILGPVAAAVTRSFQCRQANPPCTRPAACRGRRELPKARCGYRRVVSRMDDGLSQPAGERRDVALHEGVRPPSGSATPLRRSDPHWVPVKRLQRRLKRFSTSSASTRTR